MADTTTRPPFRYWVVLGGMRSGSNLLEEQLAAFPEIAAHGELFNPHFFGRPKSMSQFGLSIEAREAEPLSVIDRMVAESRGFPGFRLFYDHDNRVISHVLADPTAAKIVLTRRPIESYVSLKVARKTGQWWLGDLTSARAAKVAFDPREYAEFLTEVTRFYGRIERALQISGQTAFHIDYSALADTEVINGLGRFLGLREPQQTGKIKARVQNPGSLADRLTNPGEAEEHLASLNVPDIAQAPPREPGRGPGLKFFRACKTAPLLYMPIRGAGHDPVPAWLQSMDPDGAVLSGMSQQEMRHWKRHHPGHRSFTVLRHPLPRAHDAFCRHILPTDQESYADLRDALQERYEVPLPGPDAHWTLEDHRGSFLKFLIFLKGNLGQQTALRVDNTWASQATLLHAIAEFSVPDRVLRETDLEGTLATLAQDVGLNGVAGPGWAPSPTPFALADIQTPEIDKAVRAAYQRDFMMFGFERWVPAQAA